MGARIAAVLLVFALGLTGGWKVQAWRWAASDAKRLASEQEAARAQAMRADKAAASFEAERADQRQAMQIIYRDVERVIEKPIYRNVCLDADGLRLIARAIAPEPAASEPAPAVPTAEPAR